MRRLRYLIPLGCALAFVAAPSLAADQSVQATNSNQFTPKSVTINVGETVTWSNSGGLHNVKFDDGSYEMPADPSFTPWTVSRKFDAAGTFGYYCRQHGNKGGVGMSGTVVVQDPNAPPPPPPPPGDTTAPDVDSLRVTPATFCNKKSDKCPKRGARIRFTLSEAADVDVTILRRSTSDVVKTFSFQGKAGSNSRAYSGKGLSRAKYRLEMTAVDDAGNRSAPSKANFKVAAKR